MARFRLHNGTIKTAEESERTWQRVVGWGGIAVALIALIVLDKGSPPRKWHAAVSWTFTTFITVLIFGRTWFARGWMTQWKSNSWRFLAFWTVCLSLHCAAMWVIFGKLFPRLILGTIYVSPVAFIEGIFLVGVFLAIEHSLKEHEHRGSKSWQKRLNNLKRR